MREPAEIRAARSTACPSLIHPRHCDFLQNVGVSVGPMNRRVVSETSEFGRNWRRMFLRANRGNRSGSEPASNIVTRRREDRCAFCPAEPVRGPRRVPKRPGPSSSRTAAALLRTHPPLYPQPVADGWWTTDAWAPLEGGFSTSRCVGHSVVPTVTIRAIRATALWASFRSAG